MEFFRTDCIKSYFEIVALVNKGNGQVNKQTDVRFFITQDRLFLGVDGQQKFLLCVKRDFWKPSGSTHSELEEFICRVLRYHDLKISDLNEYIKKCLFEFGE